MKTQLSYEELVNLNANGYRVTRTSWVPNQDLADCDVHPKLAEAVAGYREDWPAERKGSVTLPRMSIAEYARRCRVPKN